MLPGKQFTPEDILRILRQRYWLVLVPFAIVSAVTAVVARKLPDRYRSETLIMVVPQRVPVDYVRSTVTATLQDRLQTISQQILSRTRLERVIQEFDLYAEERRTGIMEDIVAKMRNQDVRIDLVKGDAFTVSYEGSHPRTVMRVTERLASLFMEENTRDREILAEGTNQFLEAQLEEARARLIEQEKRVEAYRRQHAGQMPSQADSNLQALQNTQMQIQSVVESLNRDRERRLVFERQLADANNASFAPPVPTGGDTADAATTGSAVQQLEAARRQLAAQELRLKPNHPDIGYLRRRIRELEQKADAEALALPVSAADAGLPPAEAARQQRIKSLKQELENVERSISASEANEKRLRALSGQYLARIEAIPTRETELVELTRDYTGMQATYNNLLAKKEEAKIASNLERRQIGEQFKILDPARLPERPFSPDRRRLNTLGMAGGLAFGLLLIGLLEYRDTTFRADLEVASVLSLPVLAVVPQMVSEVEKRRLRLRKTLIGVSLGSTVAGCLAVVVYTFVR